MIPNTVSRLLKKLCGIASVKSKYETLRLDVGSYFYVSLVTILLTLCLDKSTDITTSRC